MKHEEITNNKKHFAGTCVNSFDEEGNCITNLPWLTVSDFAVDEENAEEINKEEFLKNVDISKELIKKLLKHKLKFMKADNVYMIYDDNTDIHYFFV